MGRNADHDGCDEVRHASGAALPRSGDAVWRPSEPVTERYGYSPSAISMVRRAEPPARQIGFREELAMRHPLDPRRRTVVTGNAPGKVRSIAADVGAATVRPLALGVTPPA
jgi:hypothetical protein